MPQSQVVVYVGVVGAADDRLLDEKAIDSGSTLLVCIILVVFRWKYDENK